MLRVAHLLDACAQSVLEARRVAELGLETQNLERRSGGRIEHELAVAQPVAEACREGACLRLAAIV